MDRKRILSITIITEKCPIPDNMTHAARIQQGIKGIGRRLRRNILSRKRRMSNRERKPRIHG
jgi:hypothetical protein